MDDLPLWGPPPAPGAPPPPPQPARAESTPPPYVPPPYVSPAPPEPPKRNNGPMILGVASVAAFLAVVGIVVVVAVRGNDAVEPAGARSSGFPLATTSVLRTTAPPRTTTTATTTTTPSLAPGVVPAGYRQVAGPGGIVVSIPQNWPVKPGAVPSNQQADDPESPGDLLRYGGSPSPAVSLLGSIAQNEVDNSGIKDGYQRLVLQNVTSARGLEVVDWEFLFDKDGETRHARARFWRLAGTDYVVYASGAVATWQRVQPVFDVLMKTAGPT